MIKVRLVPDFLLNVEDSTDFNYIYRQCERDEIFYIECSLPCVPAENDFIDLSSIRDEIFKQYSYLLLRFNKNLCQMMDAIRADPDEFVLDNITNQKDASNIDILRSIIYPCRTGDSIYCGQGIVRAGKAFYFPNDEYVYVHITWEL